MKDFTLHDLRRTASSIWAQIGVPQHVNDRLLKSNTSKRRTHSLFRQGCLLYDLIPNMPETRLRPLVEKYAQLLKQNSLFNHMFGIV